MIQLLDGGAYLVNGRRVIPADGEAAARLQAEAGVSTQRSTVQKADHCLRHPGGA